MLPTSYDAIVTWTQGDGVWS